MTVIRGVMPKDGAEHNLPSGVQLEGPLVNAKLLDSYIALTLMAIGTIGSLIWIPTQGIGWVEAAVFVGMFALTTIGIGVGFHRHLVHRSFRCGPGLRAFLCVIGTMALQGSPLKWVANHRRHHLHADKPGDVHSPYYDGNGHPIATFIEGMKHAHMAWTWDHATTEADFYAKDILNDPIAMFVHRTRWFWYLSSMIFIPAAIGYGFGGVKTMIGCTLFSGLFRSYAMTMAMALVNSVCHSDGAFGYRRFETNDGTTNELITSILTFGEGLHNNHHRFPRDAYVSHAWYEIDINGLVILGLGKLGLATDIFIRPASANGAVAVQNPSVLVGPSIRNAADLAEEFKAEVLAAPTTAANADGKKAAAA